jgi:hypothetical protein
LENLSVGVQEFHRPRPRFLDSQLNFSKISPLVVSFAPSRHEIAKKQLALNAIRSYDGIALDEALVVLDTLLANPNGVFSGLSDADKAAFVFVPLPEKVICRDKRLQTTGSLVPEGVFTPSRSSSAQFAPLCEVSWNTLRRWMEAIKEIGRWRDGQAAGMTRSALLRKPNALGARLNG